MFDSVPQREHIGLENESPQGSQNNSCILDCELFPSSSYVYDRAEQWRLTSPPHRPTRWLLFMVKAAGEQFQQSASYCQPSSVTLSWHVSAF